MNVISKTKAMLLCSALTICGITFTSCDSDQLSKRLAEKALEKTPELRDSSMVVEFNTGYYEVKGAEFKRLKQLQAAKMITAQFETIIETRKERRYDWWSGPYYVTRDVEHIFAKVAFTEEGKKLVVANPPKMREDEEKDLRIFDKEYQNEETEPEYMKISVDEPKSSKTSTTEQSESGENSASEQSENSLSSDSSEVAAAEQNTETGKSAYDIACERTQKDRHYVMIGKLKIYKVKEVFCPEEMQKNGIGTCTFIVEFTDKNPFAWVYYGKYLKNGERTIRTAELKHYDDMGWLVTKMTGDNSSKKND